MSISVGLVGLPNVGKSTLFNALTKSTIAAQNFPFCTISPNEAITPVPDKRLYDLLRIFQSQEIIPCSIKFVDIAGLVEGASKGQGLGNQFLSHIMEVDLIIHVLRCFEDSSIIHVNNRISPTDDYSIISSELLIKDLESLEKREVKLQGLIKKTSDAKAKALLLEEQKINQLLKAAAEDLDLDTFFQITQKAKLASIPLIPLLGAKKFLVAANFSEELMQNKAFENTQFYKNLVDKFGKNQVIPISAKIEEDLSRMSQEEQIEMRQMLEIDDVGFNALIQKSFEALGKICFFTCGPKEIHAWATRLGALIPEAAGEIHSDLEKGFICAEVYNYSDLVIAKTVQELKNTGKIRVEGKDYVIQDGDIINVRFNV